MRMESAVAGDGFDEIDDTATGTLARDRRGRVRVGMSLITGAGIS
jgi:hypothetical protein